MGFRGTHGLMYWSISICQFFATDRYIVDLQYSDSVGHCIFFVFFLENKRNNRKLQDSANQGNGLVQYLLSDEVSKEAFLRHATFRNIHALPAAPIGVHGFSFA